MEKNRRIAIAGKTPGDVRDDVIHGEGGLLNCTPGFDVDRLEYNKNDKTIVWPNGSRADIFSGANPEDFRGFSGDTFFCDELAAWKYPEESFDNLMFGVREGVDVRGVISTTPKPLRFLQNIEGRDGTIVTTGSSYENEDNLSERFYKEVIEEYENTSVGDQEIHAKYVEVGAHWSTEMLVNARSDEDVPEMKKIVVAVDPAVSDSDDSDEWGIVEVGEDRDGMVWVIGDYSGNFTTDEAINRVVDAYEVSEADKVIAEVNNGGDLVEQCIKNVDEYLAFDDVRATRGKKVRAQPVSMMYERGEVRHNGYMEHLENQLLEFVGDNSDDSPDRADALIWGCRYLQDDDSFSGFY